MDNRHDVDLTRASLIRILIGDGSHPKARLPDMIAVFGRDAVRSVAKYTHGSAAETVLRWLSETETEQPSPEASGRSRDTPGRSFGGR